MFFYKYYFHFLLFNLLMPKQIVVGKMEKMRMRFSDKMQEEDGTGFMCVWSPGDHIVHLLWCGFEKSCS